MIYVLSKSIFIYTNLGKDFDQAVIMWIIKVLVPIYFIILRRKTIEAQWQVFLLILQKKKLFWQKGCFIVIVLHSWDESASPLFCVRTLLLWFNHSCIQFFNIFLLKFFFLFAVIPVKTQLIRKYISAGYQKYHNKRKWRDPYKVIFRRKVVAEEIVIINIEILSVF